MSPLVSGSLRWGGIIGLVNLVWLYAAFYLGMHTSSMGQFWMFMAIWFVMNIGLYAVALRTLRAGCESWSFGRGLGAGAIMGVVSAIVAALSQVGYFTVVNPDWQEYLVGRTEEFLHQQGLPAEQIEVQLEKTRAGVTLPVYAVQSAVTALLTGLFLSAVLMGFLRRKPASQ